MPVSLKHQILTTQLMCVLRDAPEAKISLCIMYKMSLYVQSAWHACMFWVEIMLYIFPGSPMKLKERPANPYITGSELPPAQLLRPPLPHEAPPDTCTVATYLLSVAHKQR